MAQRSKGSRRRAPKCPDCRTALSHCHDTLVVHADGSVECTGGVNCEARVDRHGLVITCEELARCGCLEVLAAG